MLDSGPVELPRSFHQSSEHVAAVLGPIGAVQEKFAPASGEPMSER
jgi:hypothetical protein